MAITETGAIYKAFSFDNVSSRDYGVYITSDAVYNAPERDVEIISIPGRNGAFALDRGRFENIEVTYPAGIFTESEGDFVESISDFRNFLCSKNGYVRLTDEYNPSEYRMAVYKSGLDVTPTQLRAGEFDITFECMPQRWLTSGESEISVSDGDTITNPTLFESRPLLEAEGYGRISINGDTITLYDAAYGEIVAGSFSSTQTSGALVFDDSQINVGDDIWLSTVQVTHATSLKSGYSYKSASVSSTTNDATATIGDSGRRRTLATPELNLAYGTSATETFTANYGIGWKKSGSSHTGTASLTLTLDYDGVNTITYTITYSLGTPYKNASVQIVAQSIKADSTVSALGHPAYIDLDIGAAWNEDSGSVTSMNNVVDFPSELPVLVPGSNVISFDNTITDLKIIPRWWKV